MSLGSGLRASVYPYVQFPRADHGLVGKSSFHGNLMVEMLRGTGTVQPVSTASTPRLNILSHVSACFHPKSVCVTYWKYDILGGQWMGWVGIQVVSGFFNLQPIVRAKRVFSQVEFSLLLFGLWCSGFSLSRFIWTAVLIYKNPH